LGVIFISEDGQATWDYEDLTALKTQRKTGRFKIDNDTILSVGNKSFIIHETYFSSDDMYQQGFKLDTILYMRSFL
jgi:hypothetical protein